MNFPTFNAPFNPTACTKSVDVASSSVEHKVSTQLVVNTTGQPSGSAPSKPTQSLAIGPTLIAGASKLGSKPQNTIKTYWAQDQGAREYMEDFLSLYEDDDLCFGAVFDGHGDRTVALWLSTEFQLRAIPLLRSYQDEHLRVRRLHRSKGHINKVWLQLEEQMKRLVLEIDLHMYRLFDGRDEVGGSTMIMAAFLKRSRLMVLVNVGDSHAVVGAAESGRIRLATIEHKLAIRSERERIRRSNGFIARGRVNGVLSLTRAFGDFSLKTNPSVSLTLSSSPSDPPIDSKSSLMPMTTKPVSNTALESKSAKIVAATTTNYHPGLGPVSTWADVYTFRYSARNVRFIILGSDGIWDVLTNEEALAVVEEAVLGGHDPAQMLIHVALKRDSTDNLTAIVFEVSDNRWS